MLQANIPVINYAWVLSQYSKNKHFKEFFKAYSFVSTFALVWQIGRDEQFFTPTEISFDLFDKNSNFFFSNTQFEKIKT